MKLYEIANDYKTVEDMEGDVTDTLDMIEGEFSDKAGNILALVKNWDSDIAGLDAEINRLQDIKKQVKAQQDRLREYLRFNMERTGINQIKLTESPLMTITLKKATVQCEIVDADMLPDDLVTVKTTIAPDKREILKRLKEGEDIPGAKLVEGKRGLQIK